MRRWQLARSQVGYHAGALVGVAGAGGGAVTEFVRTEVDGVPTLWAAAEGALRAGLVFRVGRADETLARGGVTHLVEHLALHPIGQTDHHFNGVTGPITTAFFTQGDPGEVTQFLAGVCRSLQALPMDRLPAERGILRTESSGRDRSVADPLAGWRYGPASYGLAAYAEFGLYDLTPEDLRSWVARWFTRGNAVLWLAGGPPPAGLRLDLPDGPRMPAPAPSSALPRTPAFFAAEVDGIAFDTIVRRTSAAGVFAAVLDRRLHATLRRERGTSYATWAAYQPRDGQFATVTAFADALQDRHGEVTEAFVDVLGDLAAGAVPAGDLAAVRAQAEDALCRSGAAGALVPAAATDLLTGSPVLTPRQRWELVREVTAGQVQAAAQEALASGLLMVPLGRSVGRAGFTAAPAWSPDTVAGRSFRPVDHPVDRKRLVIGPDGVSLVDGRQVATVRFADCVGMLSWPDGARSLFGSDGINLRLEPRLWRLPRHVLDKLDGSIPGDRVAHLPERPPEALPSPRTGRAQRTWARVRPLLTRPVLVALAVAVALLVLILAVPSSDRPRVEVGRGLWTGVMVGLMTLVVRLFSRRH
jgi:zinc protease